MPFFTGKHRGVALAGNNVYFLSNDAKLHSIDMKTGKANWVKSYDGFPYPKDFAKSQDANGFITTVGPMAIPGGTIIVPTCHSYLRGSSPSGPTCLCTCAAART